MTIRLRKIQQRLRDTATTGWSTGAINTEMNGRFEEELEHLDDFITGLEDLKAQFADRLFDYMIQERDTDE